MLTDYFTFFSEVRRSFLEVGAMFPSSSHLGKLMIEPLSRSETPLHILEVGPGTGPFTKMILDKMGPKDTFVICEINSRFMSLLKAKLSKLPAYQRNKDRVFFFEGAVQDLPRSDFNTQFDVIVSSLPFLNFTPEMVDELFETFDDMLAEDGSLTFFYYFGLSKIRSLLFKKSRLTRVKRVEAVIDGWCCKASSRGLVSKKTLLFKCSSCNGS